MIVLCPSITGYVPRQIVVWRYLENKVDVLPVDRVAVDKGLMEYIEKMGHGKVRQPQ